MEYDESRLDERREVKIPLSTEEMVGGDVNDGKNIPQVQIQNSNPQDITEKEEMTCQLANLRVQRLKNEEYLSSSSISSSAYTTEEDDDEVDPEVRDAHLGVFVVPNEELCLKIIRQVELMFSDSFVYRDAFMTKHIRRGPGGFVSLRLITSIRKVKSLSQDYRVVAHALRGSSELEVNEDGTKVRRIKPLPDTFDPALSQAILVSGLPRDGTLHEKVDEVVSIITNLTEKHEDRSSNLNNKPSVRIIKEAAHVPSSYGPDQSALFNFDRGVCLLLDFYGFEDIRQDEARRQFADSTSEWKSQLQVHKLPSIMADPRRKKPRKTKAQRGVEAAGRDLGKMPPVGSFFTPGSKAGTSFSPNRHRQSRLDSSGSSGNRLQVSSPWSTPGSSPRSSPRVGRHRGPGPSPLATALNSSGGESPAGSPWMQRKARVQQGITSPSECSRPIFKTLREPRGPGIGRGFELVRKMI